MTKFLLFATAIAVVAQPSSAFVQSPSSSATKVTSSTTRTPASKSDDDVVTDRRSAVYGLAGLAISPFVVLPPSPANARLEGVNNPDLLPSEPGLNVIQVEKFLTKGQEKKVNAMLTSLEKDTGFRVKLLCQAYPRTPGESICFCIRQGSFLRRSLYHMSSKSTNITLLSQNLGQTEGLAIRDYWDLGTETQKDDKYVVLVADEFGGKGNVLNFNVGEGCKFALPNIFFTRLTGKYGTTFYVR